MERKFDLKRFYSRLWGKTVTQPPPIEEHAKAAPKTDIDMRREAMRRALDKLYPEVQRVIQKMIIEYGSTTFNEEVVPSRGKFVREGERIILFPDISIAMHSQFAAVAGMSLPDDGGFYGLNKNERSLTVSGVSSSLYINSRDNPEREITNERILQDLPSDYTLESQ